MQILSRVYQGAASGSEGDTVSKLIQRDPLYPSLLSGWNAESGMGMLVW
jgi:hypothetical protein